MWTPIELDELYDEINRGDAAMDHPTRRLWNAIRVEPQKWRLHPWGDWGGGFWVVGVIGNCAVWYNDIEFGFNISRYEVAGELQEYWCNQDELSETIQSVQSRIDNSWFAARAGPPQPIPAPSGNGPPSPSQH